MSTSNFEKIDSIYQQARKLEPEARAAYLAAACADDHELRRHVEALLSASLANSQTRASGEPATVTVVSIGTQLGPYRVLEPIGAGGMGQVFRGLDTRLDRPVAVKISQRNFDERFEREARAISAVNHPHICTLYDVGSSPSGVAYLVMELVEGETMAARLKGGTLAVNEILHWGAQIADALAAAHAKGIIHRDLKPANVMVTASGVKVLDFGLAKSALDITMTASNVVMGTPAYMAPEQFEGKEADARTDIYALGLLLYEMANGTRFNTTSRNAQTGHALDSIISKCLEREPDLRYQHATELHADLLRATRSLDVSHSISDRPAAAGSPSRTRYVLSAGAVAILIALAAGYIYLHRAPKLTDKDTIILADFKNTTGDAAFDDTLRQGLAVQLQQSPLLSLISEERIRRTLGLMEKPPDVRLSPEIAREVCVRSGGAAMLEGSITGLGRAYVVGLRATNCNSGDILAEEQVQAAAKEDVLNALTQVASKFRSRVGESLSTIEKHNVPLAEATTSSIEALQAYTLALKAAESGTSPLAHLTRAIEIDPQFASAWVLLGLTHSNLGESRLAIEETTKAYELRDRATDPEKFFITANYDRQVTGNLERESQTCGAWTQTYPRDINAWSLCSGYIIAGTGQFELGIARATKAVRMDPDAGFSQSGLVYNYFAINRFAEAQKAFNSAKVRLPDSSDLAVIGYNLCFVTGDLACMEREVANNAGKPDTEEWLTHIQSLVAVSEGKLEQANQLSRRAVEMARKSGQLERAATFEAAPAVWDGLFGNRASAKQKALLVLSQSQGREVEFAASFALALAGDNADATRVAEDLRKRFPEDTAVNSSYLPAIRGMIALNQNHVPESIESLRPSSLNEFISPKIYFDFFYGNLYPTYIRGQAFLAAHKGTEAAIEFQKIIDHPGLVSADPIGALAHFQIGRALAMAGNKTKAAGEYGRFLDLWKNADAAIPVLQQAKAERAALN